MAKATSYTLIGLGAAALLTVGVFMIPKNEHVNAGDDDLTRDDVTQIVEEYIRGNPQVIIDSLNSFQEKRRVEEQAQAQEGAKEITKELANLDMPIAGNPDGDVTVIEFFDYNCGFCKRVLPNVQKLIEQDKQVKVVFMEFPILSPASETASRIALAVNKIDPDKYFDFHNKLMMSQGQKDENALLGIAAGLGLDKDKVKAEMQSAEVTAQLDKTRQLASKAGIRGTPAFIIGDDLIPGAVDVNALKAAVGKARAGS